MVGLHVLIRRLAPFVGVPVFLVVAIFGPGTALVSLLLGFVSFAAVLWLADVVWKRFASPEERLADLEERNRDPFG